MSEHMSYRIERVPEGWMAVEPRTDVYGIGNDQKAAVSDLRKQLVSHRQALQAMRHRLSPRLLQDLAYLERLEWTPGVWG
jgi:hypothetical protein